MSSTSALGLPLVQPSQAQKHVTVNEAFTRLDALTQMTLSSRSQVVPPGAPGEGAAYAVPAGATDLWSGQDGQVAIFANGGWVFLAPRIGWRAWVEDEGVSATFDGADWVVGAASISPNGAGFGMRVIEIDHGIGAGATSDTVPVIPAQSVVFGVTGLVLADITGTATSWRLGISGVSDNRYGSGLGLGTGSWLRGITSEPLAYYADTALTLTGEGGDFADGTVRLAIHIAELGLPRA